MDTGVNAKLPPYILVHVCVPYARGCLCGACRQTKRPKTGGRVMEALNLDAVG